MSEKSVVVLGLPGSGKTTYLAALWHVISGREIETKLKFVTLRAGNAVHLNAIADQWRQARKQERTSTAGDRIVSMTVKGTRGESEVVVFPDVAGEAFRDMWETRECDENVASLLKSSGVLLFIHADKINSPTWLVDEIAQCRELGIEFDPGKPVPWSPRLAPTQVQVIDLLQMLQSGPLANGNRRVAIMLSAWDKVTAEGLPPAEYLKSKLPLLDQFIKNRLNGRWDVRIYGISAQGGDYDDEKNKYEEAELMRAIDKPSERISVIFGDSKSHDLTEPLDWVLE
jgi:hypothetical protein